MNNSGIHFVNEAMVRERLADILDAEASTVDAVIAELADQQKTFTRAQLRKIFKALRKAQAASLRQKESAVKAEQLMLPESVLMPSDFVFNGNALHTVHETEDQTYYKFQSHSFFYVSAKTRDLDSGEVGAEVTFWHDGGWKSIIVLMEIISQRQKVVTLAKDGINVTSENASAVVSYLSGQYHISVAGLPLKYVTKRSGWLQVDGEMVFVVGSQAFGSNTMFHVERIVDGDNSVATAFKTEGSYEAWVTSATFFLAYPVPLLALGVALSSPLLHIIGVAGYLFHLWSKSTVGKTTAALPAISAYGNPANGGLRSSWNTTLVGIEMRLFSSNSLPLLFDDSSELAKAQVGVDVVYMIGNGGGRVRGAKGGGLRETAKFRLAVLSNGETPLIANNTLRGAEVRTIEANINPFFGGQQYEQDEFSTLIKDHTDVLTKNYGHAGQKYIRYLVAVVNAPERKEKLIVRYREIRSQLSKGVENPYLLRSIDYFAVIQLSLEIASRILPELNITTNQITNAVQLILDRQRLNLQQGGDIDHRALSYVWDKIISEPERFEGKAYEYWGAKVSRRSSVSKVGYAFLPNKLEELLVKGGFNYRSSLQYFKANGWIWLDAKGELWAVTIKKEFDSEPNTKRCVVFDKDAALKAGILVENDSDEPSNKAPVLSLVPQPVMDELEPPEHLVEAFNAACDK